MVDSTALVRIDDEVNDKASVARDACAAGHGGDCCIW
jgi:hypothetical protein